MDLDALLDLLADKLADRLASRPQNENGNGHAPEQDKLLGVEEAAKLLSVTPRWLYGHADALGFVVHLPGRAVRFSARGIERYIARKSR